MAEGTEDRRVNLWLLLTTLNHRQSIATAEKEYLGCDITEIIRSHAVVFAADKTRLGEIILDFPSWWQKVVAVRPGL